MAQPRLSIVVVNFETPDYTLECIRSIFANPPESSFEIILIDNGSKDGSLEIIREQAPKVSCIETGQNLGFAQANNLGIRNARGEYVLLLNSDTKILDNSLDRLLKYLELRPRVGAVGLRQLDGEGRLQLSWGHFPTFITETFRKLLHYRLSLNDLRIRDYLEEKYSASTLVDWVSGSCLMARKKALEEAGLFDGYFFMYFEDIDLCRRLRDRRWEIHYCPDPMLIHYGGVSAKKNLLKVLVEYRRSQIHFTRKYYGWGGVSLLKTLLLFKFSIYFLCGGAVFLRDFVMRWDTASSFSKLLLSKKTLELILRPAYKCETVSALSVPGTTKTV